MKGNEGQWRVMKGNGRIENFGRNWTSRKKLEKQNCDEKEVDRILKKKVVCKTPKRVRGQK